MATTESEADSDSGVHTFWDWQRAICVPGVVDWLLGAGQGVNPALTS